MTDIIEQKTEQKLADRKKPSPNDKITNPLSNHKTVAEKRAAYNQALDNHVDAKYYDHKTKAYVSVPLGTSGAEFNDVEFIAGIWRIQNKFNLAKYDVITIQGKQFILLKKLDRTERTNFEYFSAASVGWSAHGLSCDFQPTYIVSRYVTNRGTFYGYGCTITSSDALATARAHLMGKVYEAYQDLIDNEIENNREKTK